MTCFRETVLRVPRWIHARKVRNSAPYAALCAGIASGTKVDERQFDREEVNPVDF
jgi:hypothetical protein